jgi:hypothetical protein
MYVQVEVRYYTGYVSVSCLGVAQGYFILSPLGVTHTYLNLSYLGVILLYLTLLTVRPAEHRNY